MSQNDPIFEPLKRITTFLFDVDGVLTDGSVTLMPGGEQVRKMNIKDGYALQLAIKKGYKVAIITGGRSQEVVHRMAGLGIQKVFLGSHNKLEVFEELCITDNIKPEECLYMGDDIPDYEVMTKVAFACSPADAAIEIQQISRYVSNIKGGEGCVRDVIERTMRIQGNWYDPSQHQLTAFTW